MEDMSVDVDLGVGNSLGSVALGKDHYILVLTFRNKQASLYDKDR